MKQATAFVSPSKTVATYRLSRPVYAVQSMSKFLTMTCLSKWTENRHFGLKLNNNRRVVLFLGLKQTTEIFDTCFIV